MAILRSLLGLGLCLGIFLMACEKTQSESFKPQLAVHCLLVAGDGNARVTVNRTYQIGEAFDSLFDGAEVTLSHGSRSWRLRYYGRDLYGWFVAYPYPHDTWYLRVTKPGFDTVYGSTVVPDTFTILYPAKGETVNTSDSMGWTRSRNCRGYDIAMVAVRWDTTIYYDIVLSNDSSGGQRDSLKVNLPQMFFLYGYNAGSIDLPVLALDTNYYDWVNAGGFGPGAGSGDTTHLVGGVGVFGSASMQEIGVYNQPDAAGPRCLRATPDQSAGYSSGKGLGAVVRREQETECGPPAGRTERATVGNERRRLQWPASRR